jgi:hypothetical protein
MFGITARSTISPYSKMVILANESLFNRLSQQLKGRRRGEDKKETEGTNKKKTKTFTLKCHTRAVFMMCFFGKKKTAVNVKASKKNRLGCLERLLRLGIIKNVQGRSLGWKTVLRRTLFLESTCFISATHRKKH